MKKDYDSQKNGSETYHSFSMGKHQALTQLPILYFLPRTLNTPLGTLDEILQYPTRDRQRRLIIMLQRRMLIHRIQK